MNAKEAAFTFPSEGTISIEVRYKIAGDAQWIQRRLTPSGYFWSDPERPTVLAQGATNAESHRRCS
jgi:hypothetical protein